MHLLPISKRHQQGKNAYSVAKRGKDKNVLKLPAFLGQEIILPALCYALRENNFSD